MPRYFAPLILGHWDICSTIISISFSIFSVGSSYETGTSTTNWSDNRKDCDIFLLAITKILSLFTSFNLVDLTPSSITLPSTSNGCYGVCYGDGKFVVAPYNSNLSAYAYTKKYELKMLN